MSPTVGLMLIVKMEHLSHSKVTRELVLGLIMFRLVVTSSNIFDKGKQFVNGMLKSTFFFPSLLLLNFQLKSIWTTGEERVKEEGVILHFLFF